MRREPPRLLLEPERLRERLEDDARLLDDEDDERLRLEDDDERLRLEERPRLEPALLLLRSELGISAFATARVRTGI